MGNFREELKELPEWFNKENETLKIMGKNKYTLVLNKNESGEKALVYLVYKGDNANVDKDALIYIYYDGFVGAQFKDYAENNTIDFEDAKTIVYNICDRFNLPRSIPINFHRKKRQYGAKIEFERIETIDGR